MKYIAAGIMLLLLAGCAAQQPDRLVPFKMDITAVCGFPGLHLPDDAVVLSAGAYGGRRLDYQIDQSGDAATQIDVAVNSPHKPVILMLGASEPTIWNVGWTVGTRIVAVFANGYHTQRVAGLRKNTPLLLSSNDNKGPCLVGYFSGGKISSTEQNLSRKLFSRDIAGFSKVVDGRVVVGEPVTPDQTLITSSHTPPESFRDKKAPLAGAAGLEAAVRKGILRRATVRDAEKWREALKQKYAKQNLPPPNIPPDLFNAYTVLKEFTCPAGLYGGNRATFYVPEGVAPPKGNCGHSRIYDLNSVMLGCTLGSACGQAMMRGSIGSGSNQQVITIDPSGAHF